MGLVTLLVVEIDLNDRFRAARMSASGRFRPYARPFASQAVPGPIGRYAYLLQVHAMNTTCWRSSWLARAWACGGPERFSSSPPSALPASLPPDRARGGGR